MANAMRPFRDSHAISLLSGPRIDVTAEPPLVGPVYKSSYCPSLQFVYLFLSVLLCFFFGVCVCILFTRKLLLTWRLCVEIHC